MIYVNEPVIGEAEKKYVLDCLNKGWVSSAGSYVLEFENKWSSYCGMKHGIAVSNGTAALELAIRALDIKPGSEVILPSFTIISCIQAIVYSGLKPILVDCDADTWCMSISEIEKKITPKTKAIMPVHMYGHPVDMDPLIKLSKKYDLLIIEDSAEAHGCEYKGQKCGSFGDISTFSFFANKIITTGEGGMILTNNDTYAENARELRNLCFKNDRRFKHDKLGFNYRLTNLQAALGVGQIERIDEIVKKKIAIANYYLKHLNDLECIQLPVEKEWAKNVYWVFGFVLKDSTNETARSFAKKMRDEGIETRPFFLGMHEQPFFKKSGTFAGESYPTTEKIAKQGLYIPSGLNLTEDIQKKVIDAILKILNV